MSVVTGAKSEPAQRQPWRSVVRSAGARVFVLPVSAVLGIVSTRLIIENFGQAAYAQYGLLVTLGSLLPFADLGLAAAIMNSVGGSDNPAVDDRVHRVLTTTIRVLFCSMCVLLAAAVLITVLGWWPTILGNGLVEGSGPIVAGLCLAMIAITLVVGIGQRILTGLGKNHFSIIVAGLQTPLVLVAILVLVGFNLGDGTYIAVIPYIATFFLAIVMTVIAAKMIKPAVKRAYLAAPRLKTERGGKVFDVAWPMLVQMIALPIAMQSDRIVLSHVSDLGQLAEYNISSQLFTPVWAVTSAAGLALWPIFARSRVKGGDGPSPKRMALGFGGAAAIVCLGLSVASGWLVGWASGGTIVIGLPMLVAFSIFMIFQAVKYPLGMYMTDSRGLRFQAYMILLMVPVNLGLSIALARQLGAVGPIIGSAVGVLLFQVLANWLYVSREQRRRALAASVEPSGSPEPSR